MGEDGRPLIERICAGCAHGRKLRPDPYRDKLLHYFRLGNAGCPIERHELEDHEWLDLGEIKAAWAGLEAEWWKKNPAKP